MKIYADRFPRFVSQIVADLFVVAWIYFWVRAGLWLRDQVEKLAVPGQKLEGAGTGLADGLADAGGRVGRVPVVGDELTTPFEKAAAAARAVAEAGQDQQNVVHDLALGLAVVTMAFPIALALVTWLPLRVRWIRRASAAASMRQAPAGRDLLALRALTSQPLRKIAKVGPDAAVAWREADPDTIKALADIELRALGLKAR